jgi:3-dehydroquinate dehydratase-2
MPQAIYVLNGPNLNLLGTREPEIYGRSTLKDIEAMCREAGKRHGYDVECRQSNHEGQIIDWMHEAREKGAAGIIINPAGYTSTSIAFLDAIKAVGLPTIEIHISNIHAREEFRHHSFVSRAAKAMVCGFGVHGYVLAIDGLVALLKAKG